MKLSVIVPAFKLEQYILPCLLSVLEQEVNFDYEVIVCDDASPDSTVDKIASIRIDICIVGIKRGKHDSTGFIIFPYHCLSHNLGNYSPVVGVGRRGLGGLPPIVTGRGRKSGRGGVGIGGRESGD